MKGSGLNLEKLQDLVRSNDKQRFSLIFEGPDGEILENVSGSSPVNPEAGVIGSVESQTPKKKGVWLLCARQGHSMKVRQLVDIIRTDS